MKHIAFFINNRMYAEVDCRDIVNGNPGIGGSEYMKILISYLLTIRKNDIDVTVFSTVKGAFPKEINTEIVENLTDAVIVADKQHMDFIIFDHNPQNMMLVKGIRLLYLKFIPWCHNFASIHALDLLSKDNRVFKIITVGREQKDLYRDHPAFYKTEYIYNCINIKSVEKYDVASHPVNKRDNNVTYIGAINRYKGFHRLAQAWPEIIANVPDAHLFVIGAGNLYDRNKKLGKWGIADEEYENYFMQYLTRDGKILDSVHFLGVLGEEKNKIFLQTKVGVPNPTGASETFCLSALEMQMLGAIIVSKECAGFLDTVLAGTLVKKSTEIANVIIKELRKPQGNYHKTISDIANRFSTNVVIKDWEELILTGEINRWEDLVNKTFRYKQYKEYLRILKKKLPIFSFIPPIESLLTFYNVHIKSRLSRSIKDNKFDYIDFF